MHKADYAGSMSRFVHSLPLFALAVSAALLPGQSTPAATGSTWTFAVSGDSRNCGDYVMPAIAARVKGEGDQFYWHLGDFRRMSAEDEDMLAAEPATGKRTLEEYRKVAWDDFLQHQMASFGDFPVFLGRGNHEVGGQPNSRELYRTKFASYLSRPEIVAQDEKDKSGAAPKSSPWYHFVRDGIDFITMDNAEKEEFSEAQLTWLRGVLDRDLAANSGVKTIVMGAHEAMPGSLNSNHAMDESSPAGIAAGEKAYRWFAEAQKKGMHVYLIASHSHYYSPGIYNSPKWKGEGMVVPGLIIGSAGARRYKLPDSAPAGAKTHIYGYVQATVSPDRTVKFDLKEISEDEMTAHKWPELPQATLHECFVGNAE